MRTSQTELADGGMDIPPRRWSMAVAMLRRPYRVTIPMVALVMLVPLYLFIPDLALSKTFFAPSLTLDQRLPLLPLWSVIYGALYFFLIALPVIAVRDDEHIRRTVWAYLAVWLFAYASFIMYPTVAPRPLEVHGQSFGTWGLRFLYSSDPPYNCFPSLHVAHSFVSALTCHRLHRGVGIASAAAAFLVALSTLFTKQHYVLDVLAGMLLAYAAYLVFLRNYSRGRVSKLDHEAAPILAVGLLWFTGGLVLVAWLGYLFSVG